jgi:hypothetical protein
MLQVDFQGFGITTESEPGKANPPTNDQKGPIARCKLLSASLIPLPHATARL